MDRTLVSIFLYQKLKKILIKYIRIILTASKDRLISKIWRVCLKNWVPYAHLNFEVINGCQLVNFGGNDFSFWLRVNEILLFESAFVPDQKFIRNIRQRDFDSAAQAPGQLDQHGAKVDLLKQG